METLSNVLANPTRCRQKTLTLRHVYWCATTVFIESTKNMPHAHIVQGAGPVHLCINCGVAKRPFSVMVLGETGQRTSPKPRPGGGELEQRALQEIPPTGRRFSFFQILHWTEAAKPPSPISLCRDTRSSECLVGRGCSFRRSSRSLDLVR